MSGAGGRRSVAVWIAGHEYKIRSEGDDDGLIRIAGYVDRAMHRVRERTGTVDSLDVAVLTCLNLAREILALHERSGAGTDDQKLKSLIGRVESALSGHVRTESASEQAPVATIEVEAEVDQRTRTLELPSVEDLRERIAAGGAIESRDSGETAPRARAAAGGRDRVG